MDVFRAFFGCRGDGGFNGCCAEASSGDGGFMLACISSRRGVIGFKAVMSLCPVREIVRPARSDGGSEREKVRPASSKRPKIGGFWRAGRVFSRKYRVGAAPGELFRGNAGGGPVPGELFRGRSREGPVLGEFSCGAVVVGAPRRLDVPDVPDEPVGIRLGDLPGPGAWRARRRPASRRSGTPVPPTRRPSRSSGMRARSHGR